MSRYLLRSAMVVSEGVQGEYDVLIANGRIERIGKGIASNGAEEFDCAGLHLLPGLIDDQVHFREPGMEHKAVIASESTAAVCGGVTSFLEMPNTRPPTADADALADKLKRAAAGSRANYGFYLGATGSNGDVLHKAADMPACGIKVFLGASTGDLLVSELDQLVDVFAAVPPGMVIAAHCEDHERVQSRQKEFLAEHGENLSMHLHPEIRDRQACIDSTKQACDLAQRLGTRLHVLHITTAEEVQMLSTGQKLCDKQITAEACVHHLWFCDEDYSKLGGLIKCNPAIKTAQDRAALRAAVAAGDFDIIATDHAPHLLSEKQGAYSDIAAGLPLVQHSLLILLDLVRSDVLGLEDAVRLATHNPAELFGIVDRGYIREGCFADLVLVDLSATTRITNEDVHYKCGWTPLDGYELAGQIRSVWVSGQLAVREGKLNDDVRGLALEYNRRQK